VGYECLGAGAGLGGSPTANQFCLAFDSPPPLSRLFATRQRRPSRGDVGAGFRERANEFCSSSIDAALARPSPIVEGTAVNLLATALEADATATLVDAGSAAQLIVAQRGTAGVGPARGALAGFGMVSSMRCF
jgi:hypothetical protein